MPNIKSSKKDVISSKIAYEKNKAAKSALKTIVKKFDAALASGDKTAAQAAYTAAITVGVLRVYNNKHWFTDVFAGAGVGILSARIGYWMLPYTRKFMHKLTGLDAFVYPAVSDRSAAVGLSLRF